MKKIVITILSILTIILIIYILSNKSPEINTELCDYIITSKFVTIEKYCFINKNNNVIKESIIINNDTNHKEDLGYKKNLNKNKYNEIIKSLNQILNTDEIETYNYRYTIETKNINKTIYSKETNQNINDIIYYLDNL